MMSTPQPCRQQSRFLPAFLLLLLAEQPLHGGALRSLLAERVPDMRADSAAIYRALSGLEKAGCLRSKWNTGGAGPAIRVYEVTAAGWKRLDFWREDIDCRLRNLQYFVDSCAKLKRPKKN